MRMRGPPPAHRGTDVPIDEPWRRRKKPFENVVILAQGCLRGWLLAMPANQEMEQAILDNAKLDKNIEDLQKMLLLTKEECKGLCEKAIAILQEEANVQPIRCPVTVCGDIHGQFPDLKESRYSLTPS